MKSLSDHLGVKWLEKHFDGGADDSDHYEHLVDGLHTESLEQLRFLLDMLVRVD